MNGVGVAALLVTTTLFVTEAGSSGSSKSKVIALGQSDCPAAPFVGLTETNRGGRASGNRKLRVAVTVLLAVSVARTVAVKAAPLLGALASEKLNVFVTSAEGAATTLRLCVAANAPLNTACN